MAMIFNQLLLGFGEIGHALVRDLSVWWVLTPIFLLWISMELYFGEYKQEQLGFSSALANGVSLAWVSVTSLRLFTFEEGLQLTLQFLILLFFLLYSVIIIWASFMHTFSPQGVSILASTSLIYFFSTLSVLWGQRLLTINIGIVSAFIILFLLIYLLLFVIKRQLGVLGEIETVKYAGNQNKQQNQ